MLRLNPILIDSDSEDYCEDKLKRPLLECRIPHKDEIAHWEFYNWGSFLSTTQGLINEPATEDI